MSKLPIIMRVRQFALIVSVCVSVGAGCGDNQRDPSTRPSSRSSTPIQPSGGSHHEWFVAGVHGAKATTLYEGLPHQKREREAFEKELASRATMRLHEFPFYQEKLVLSDSDERALREIVYADNTFEALSGEKKCGGFHPDYGVEWHDGDGNSYRMLVCFGCREATLFGPGEEVRYDIRRAAYEQMAAILKPYRKNRPNGR